MRPILSLSLVTLALFISVIVFLHTFTTGIVTPSSVQAAGPTKTVTYQPDNSIIANPERAWYWAYNPICCYTDRPHSPLNVSELKAMREGPDKITLINDRIQMGMFMNSYISQQRLDEIQHDWDVAREAGFKVVFRILYDWSMGDLDPDKIWLERHIEQLKPFLAKNADVIAWVQAGLYGGTGEGGSSSHGYSTKSIDHTLSKDGAEIFVKWFRSIPQDRMMAFRFPRHIADMQMYAFPQYNWPQQLTSRTMDLNKVLTPAQAFSGSDLSRMGVYDDGTMGSEYTHFATFYLPNENEFTVAQSLYVPFEGELSWATEYNMRPGNVVTILKRFHTSAQNIHIPDPGAKAALEAWRTNNGGADWQAITKGMGYRFELESSSIPQSFAKNENFTMTMKMKNVGFTHIMNPRNVEIVLRNSTNGQKYVMKIDNGKGNRMWLPGPEDGSKNLSINTPLPNNIPEGTYEVLLHLADPYPSLHDRPEYSIRLANLNTWETNTGYNKLNHTITIGAGSGGNPTPTPTNQTEICAADFNNDKIVDLKDYSTMLNEFFKKVSQGANVKVDVNHDDIIDISDWSVYDDILILYFLQECTL